jgi:hypothetical protein
MSASRKASQRESAGHDNAKSATARERERVDDDAVRTSLDVGSASVGGETRSVLPGPPIPPDVQDKLRKDTKTPR